MAALIAACPTANQNSQPPSTQPAWQMSHYLPASLQSSAWPAMAKNFELGHNASREPVAQEIRWFESRQNYIHELTHNARPYIYYVYQQAKKRDMPTELALIPMIESNYNPFAYAHTGATGLWQMMPGTASGFGVRINWWYDGRRDIIASTKAALDYFDYLHAYFGNWLLAIAAYDSGEGTVEMAIRHNQRLHRPTDFWDLPLPHETKMYVPKLLALAEIVRDPRHYHLHLDSVPNRSYFTAVDMNHEMALSEVAELSQTSIKSVRNLNPGFRRWRTMSGHPYSLLLPKAQVATFEQQLQLANEPHTQWRHHQVSAGESLSFLAHLYRTNIGVIKEANHLTNDHIHIGQVLLIPTAANIKAHTATHHIASAKIAEDFVPGPQRMIHHVAPGDNLWTIAARFHVKPSQIRYWNNIPYRGRIHTGQELTIWVPAKHKGAYYYQVKSGDTLGRIAAHFGVTVNTLKAQNALHNNRIRIGERLQIPAIVNYHQHFHAKSSNEMITHIVRSGETLSEIAHYYGVSTSKIVHWNHLENQPYLRVGEPLHIYT